MSKNNCTRKYKESKHLTFSSREILANLLKAKKECDTKKKPSMSMRWIAKILGVSPQTVLNEIKRGTVTRADKINGKTEYSDEYSPIYGQFVYETNRMRCRNKEKIYKVQPFIEYIETAILKGKLSPDAALGRSLATGLFTKEETVSINTLYKYIGEGKLKVKNMDLKEKVSRKKRKAKPKENKKCLGISIEERPDYINNREEFGHFEIDVVQGKRGESTCLLTLTERLTRKGIIVLIDFKDTESVEYALNKIIKEYPEGTFKSITADNGSEFATLTECFSHIMDIYFAHPYSAFERGGNENFNKLIRRFIPKGESIELCDRGFIQAVMDKINEMPRKILGYMNADEAFEKELVKLTKQAA